MFDIPQMVQPSERKYRLMRFNSQGHLSHQFDINLDRNNIGRWQIIDFRPDHQGGIYLLEVLETNQQELFHRLRRVDSQGHEIWSKKAPLNYQDLDFDNLAGKFEYLIAPDRNSLYLPTRYPQQGLASFNVSNGEIDSVYKWEESPSQLTITSSQEVYYSHFLDEAAGERIILVKRNLINDHRDIIECDIQFLHNLAGIDAEGNIYPRLDSEIARLSAQGKLEWKQDIDGLVVRKEDRHIFIGSKAEIIDNMVILEVDHYDTSGNKLQKITFQIPKQQLQFQEVIPRLISVDIESNFYFYTGEKNNQAGTLLIYNSEEKLQKFQSLNEIDEQGFPLFDKVNQEILPIESQVAASNMFEIDRLGYIYIPLSDPEGFKVIRLQSN